MRRFFLFLALFFSMLHADFLQPNSSISRLNNFEFKTQNNEIVTIAKETKVVIVTFEKETGKLINDYLNEQDLEYLQTHHVVFIADMSSMPSIVISMFALPKLQKYNHPIYVNYNDGFNTVVPHKEDSATLLFIENTKIKEILYVATQEELKKAIEK